MRMIDVQWAEQAADSKAQRILRFYRLCGVLTRKDRSQPHTNLCLSARWNRYAR